MRVNCPRCDGVEILLPSTDEVSFVTCQQCNRHFRVTLNGELVDRWLSPLSLILYPVIFDTHPQKEAERIANELYASSQSGGRSIFRSFTREELQQLLSDVRLELEKPTQKVREILDLHGEEADLRQYLAAVAQRLGQLMGE